MKKILLLTKSFVILSLLFCSVGVFAGDEREPIVLSKTPTDNVPKTINVQGKLTTDSGGPITAGAQEIELKIYGKNSETPIKTSSTTANVDSDGIYTANIDVKTVDFSKPLDFEVVAGNVTSSKTPFSSSPYAFYASSSTWAQGDSKNQIISETYIKDLNIYKTSMTIVNGNGTPAVRQFPIAGKGSFGLVSIGDGLGVSGGVISIDGSGVKVSSAQWAQYDYYNNEISTTYVKGLVVNGSTITMKNGKNDTISQIYLSSATNSSWGVVSVPASDYGLSLTNGAITINPASANQYGTVIVSSAITSSGTNVVYSSAIYSAINSTYATLNSAITSTYTALNGSKANESDLYSIAFSSNIESPSSLSNDNVLVWNGRKWKPTSFGSVLGTLSAGNKIKVTTSGTIYKTYTVHLDTESFKDVVPEPGSDEPITSGGVWTGINTAYNTLNDAITSTYTALNNSKANLSDFYDIAYSSYVEVTDLAAGQALVWNGTDKWENETIPVVDNTLTEDGANAVVSSAIYSAINSTYTALNNSKANLSDFYDIAYSSYVEVTDLAAGQALVWNGTDKWENIDVQTNLPKSIDNVYQINVSTATRLPDAPGEHGDLYWSIDASGNQDWKSVGNVSIGSATVQDIGGFKLSDAKDSGLEMYGAVLKVSTGTGLTIDTETNTVNVTTAPAAQQMLFNSETIEDNTTSGDIYFWAMNSSKNKQGWYKATFSSRGGYNSYTNIEKGADLAEIYQSTEKLVPGDVVSIDPAKDNAIVKTKVAEDTMVAGVISTEPGVLMNQDEKGYKLALVGKVPTKVCNEGGAIKRGDLLVSASIPGYAKKAGDNPKVGTVIGKALENSDSQKGTILVLVNLQ